MDEQTLIKKLQTMLDEAKRNRMFGTIELQLWAGEVEIIRTSQTEKVKENNRGPKNYR